MKVKYAFRITLLATVSLLPQAALAQNAATADPAQSGLGDIVVTANRRSENIQTVPLTVAAVTGEALAAAGVGTTQGLEQVVAGLVIATTATSSQPTLRGVGTRNASPGDESNVAMYLDGVYQPAMSSNNFELLNVERVEVLKGPQGTLYGRNATGGAINIVTAKPGDQATARFAVSYGRFNEVKGAVYAAVPLGSMVSADIAVNNTYRDPWIDDVFRNGKIGMRKSFNVRGRVRFRPTDNIDIIAAISHTDTDDNSIFAVQPLNGNSVGRKVNPAVVLPAKTHQYVGNIFPESGYRQTDYNLQADFKLGFATLQSVSDYQRNTTNYVSDSDGTSVPGRDLRGDDDFTRAWSQELRLISNGMGRLQWIVGAMAFGSKAGDNPLIINSVSGAGAASQTIVRGKQDATAYAGYAEATYQALDKLFVTGGVRYSWEKRTFTPFFNAPGAPVSASFDAWTPHASVRYQFSPDANVYFTYSQGFKSGLFNIASANLTPVRPETIRSYEVGMKLQPASFLRANLSAFLYDYKDLQVSARLAGNAVAFLQNAGSAKIKGIDFDLTAAPAPGLKLNLAAEYLDAKYTDFFGAAINTPTLGTGALAGIPIGGNASVIADGVSAPLVSGNPMVRAPKLTLTAGFTYRIEAAGGVIRLGANANYNDGYSVEVSNRVRQPAYTLVNANIGWWTKDERFGISLWGENLTDEDVVQYALVSGNQDGFSYRLPAMYGVKFEGRF